MLNYIARNTLRGIDENSEEYAQGVKEIAEILKKAVGYHKLTEETK